MVDFTKLIGTMRLMAQAANDPELRRQLVEKAAETGVDPDELNNQVQGGPGMTIPFGPGGVMLPTGAASPAAAPAAGGDPSALLAALGAIQPPATPQFPNAAAPGLRTSPGLSQSALMQMILQQVLRGQTGGAPPSAPGLGQLIGGR